ncbi:hypothetical protein EC973_000041 [Apophysomyces ossiformis]|uniref:Thioesterase domain-containing protein n=1 Tax=Apophysomyces ossiformis TaxID=679940 RepID=A0A8H7BZT8_9FUNG|nr:hypothetical protein EC973_000041 [Apophysomyces ossiformis]
MLPTNVLRSPALVQKVLKSFQSAGGYDSLVLPGLRIVHSERGFVHAEFEVEKKHLNRLGSVHGGLLATVVDIGGSLALASKGLFATGVSTDINISYLSGATEGDKISVDGLFRMLMAIVVKITKLAHCDKLGKTLAFTSVDLKTSDGRLVARGRHNKFVALAYKHPENELQPTKKKLKEMLHRQSITQLSDHHLPPLKMTPNPDPSHTHCHNPPGSIDVSKHISSLKARLGFAQFKMKNGWERNTLTDVEYMWRQRQQRLVNEIPTPRFTQQDIIDRRYCNSTRAKRARLTRSLSNPTRFWPSVTDDPVPTLKYRQKSPSKSTNGQQQTYYFHHYHQYARDLWEKKPDVMIHPVKRSRSITDEEEKEQQSPNIMRNSLDYLSYAIAMTENQDNEASSQPLPDISRIEPNLLDNDEEDNELKGGEAMSYTYTQDNTIGSPSNLHLSASSSAEPSPPSSPVTAAAQAIMMFVNSHNSQ